MKNIKKVSELWNNYIEKFKIATAENYCQFDKDLQTVSNVQALIIQDNKGNLIAIDLATLAVSEAIPDYFVVENDELVGFDTSKTESAGFYPNSKFYELYQDMMSAHEIE